MQKLYRRQIHCYQFRLVYPQKRFLLVALYHYEQRWGILFRKCDEIKTCCASCGNQVKVNTVRLDNLEVTVNGVGEQIGLKGHVSELRRESSVIKWVTGGLVTAAFLALADRFIGGKK